MNKIADKILSFIPVLAPAPTAYVVGAALQRVLGWPIWVAGLAALILEGLGFVAVDTAGQIYQYNRTNNAAERSAKLTAPAGLAYAVAGLYLVVVLAFVLFLDTVKALARLAPAAFPFLSLVGFLLFTLRKDQQAREEARKEARQLAQANRHLARKALSNCAQGNVNLRTRQRQLAHKPITDNDLLAWWTAHPAASNAETGRQFGISRQAVQQRRENLTLPQHKGP